MRNLFVLFSLTLLTVSSCSGDPDGDRLFQVTYQPIDFDVPAGVPNFQTLVIAQNSIATDFGRAIRDNNVSADDIDLVGGFRARIVSLDGNDFFEIERVEIRACPVGQTGGCSQFDILFSVDDLFRRRLQTINLNPGLRNFRSLFVGDELIRVELVIIPGQTTSQTLRARLEWSVGAVGNL